MSVSVTYIVTQNMDKRAYSFISSATYRAGGGEAFFKEKQVSLASQKIMVDDEGGDFQASFPDIFAQYQNPILTGDIAMANKAWISWKTTPFDWWQCQLNFAVWCATAGCGVSVEDHLQATDPLPASLYRFHVYFTTRRILEELRVALPGEKSHSWYLNTFDARAHMRFCSEFGVSPETDWKQKLDHGCQGLGSWSTYMDPSGAYRHAHYSDGPFFHPKDAIRHNRDISGAWTMFRRVHASRCGAPQRLDQDVSGIRAILGAQAQTRSNILKPGRGSMLKSSSWPTSKTPSPHPSLDIKRRSSMHQPLWTSSLGLGSTSPRATWPSTRAMSRATITKS